MEKNIFLQLFIHSFMYSIYQLKKNYLFNPEAITLEPLPFWLHLDMVPIKVVTESVTKQSSDFQLSPGMNATGGTK